MAELASTRFSGVISFDISDELEDENEQIDLVIGNLTQEEQQEIVTDRCCKLQRINRFHITSPSLKMN